MCTEIEPVTALHLKCGPNALVLFALPVSVRPSFPSSPAPPTLFYFYSLCLSESLCVSLTTGCQCCLLLPAALISAATQSVLNFCVCGDGGSNCNAEATQRAAPCVAPSAAAPHKSCSRRAATVASVSKQCAQSTPPKN